MLLISHNPHAGILQGHTGCADNGGQYNTRTVDGSLIVGDYFDRNIPVAYHFHAFGV